MGIKKGVKKELKENLNILELWDTKAIAEFTGLSDHYVRQHLTVQPGFPSPYKLPIAVGRPRRYWTKKAIVEWEEGRVKWRRQA